jgi:hypothetical protein
MFSVPLVMLLALSGTVSAAEPAPALKHRFYIAPDEIRTLDSRTLAKLLVERIHRECDLADAPPSGDKVLGDDAALIMMVPARHFDAIARNGFLNQHQTHTTGGDHREHDRYEAEQELAMLRLPFGMSGWELLPKYAVLDVQKMGLETFRLPTQYGGVAVVFKKEVFERATWTYADSLDYSQKSGRFDAGGANNPVLARTFLYERKKEDHNHCGNYCEAQIWGKLTLNDVAYAMVRDSDTVPGVLAWAGVPVYSYSVPDSSNVVVDGGRTAQYVRGALRVVVPTAPPPLHDEAVSGDDSGGPDSLQVVGVFSEAPMKPKLALMYEKNFVTGDDETRAIALFVLSQLPWDEFKPRLLKGLDAAPGPLLITAVAFAADHRNDADVSAKLEKLRRAPASKASEWVERLDKKHLCSLH